MEKNPPPIPEGLKVKICMIDFFIVREISQLASTSRAKRGFLMASRHIEQVVEIFLCQLWVFFEL